MTALISSNRLHPRAVHAIQGWHWIVAGFRLFAKNPPIWIVFFMIYTAMELVLALFVPVIGAVAAGFLDPILIAGFMAGCRALELDEELEIGHLFVGFQAHLRQLAILGGIYLSGKIVIVLLSMGAMTILFGPLPDLDFNKLDPGDPAVLGGLTHFMVIGLLIVLLMMPLLMAYWFAPALILFDNLPAKQAMRLSFAACMKNIVPFTVYGMASLILFVVGSIPLGLGLLIVVPVLFATSIYTGYRDLFVAEGGESSSGE